MRTSFKWVIWNYWKKSVKKDDPIEPSLTKLNVMKNIV
jgi:hypothetical protein